MIQSPPPLRPRLSVVAPCYNEEESLAAFAARMTAACEGVVGQAYELVLVNDGSRDRTWAIIQAISEQYPAVVGVNLSRNHGHQLAVTAGLSLTSGERVLIIDADLQDPPELLPQMMARMDEGYDVVYGRRTQRAKESAFKKLTAGLFYRTLKSLSETDIPLDTGDFRLMSRRIVDRLNAMPERDRFIRGMVAWLGGKQTEIAYDREPRFAGQTHYTLGKMLHLATDGLASFSTAPLKLATLLAIIGMAMAGLLALYAVYGFLFGHAARGWTSLALMVVGFATAQLACLGIFGAYLGRMYMQTKGRPLFLIDEVVSRRPHPVLSVPEDAAGEARGG